jgi:hypothetical protein
VVKGYEFFVWEPKAAEIWPNVFASTSPSSAPTASAVDARNRGGRPPEYSHERIVAEALIYIAVNGKPSTLDGEGGLFEKLELVFKPADFPKRGTLYNIFNPIWKRIEDECERIEGERKRIEDMHRKSKKPGQ